MAQHGRSGDSPCTCPHHLTQTDIRPPPNRCSNRRGYLGRRCSRFASSPERGRGDGEPRSTEQVEATEIAQVAGGAKHQYDVSVAAQDNRSLLARDEDLPSGEVGASSSDSSPNRRRE